MVGIRSAFVVSTETIPRFPFASRPRIVTVDCSPEGPGTILPSTNTDTRKTRAGIARIYLFHLLFGCLLTSGTRTPGAGFTLNEVEATVPRVTRDIDGIGFHDAAFFSGSALGVLAHDVRDFA